VPFDLQPLRVINYDKNDPSWGSKLKNNLIKAIDETLKTPIEVVPTMFRKVVKSKAPAESETKIRLSTLERKVSALSSALREGQYSDSLPGRDLSKFLLDEIAAVSTMTEVRDIFQKYIDRGYPKNKLIEVLKPYLSKSMLTKMLQI